MTEIFRLEEISFSYDSTRTVLQDMFFSLSAGERIFLKGKNGSGKTTLLHLMVGLLVPSSGTISAFGKKRIREADFYEVRARAGLLFQDPEDQLFCPTVREDVAFGPLNLGQSQNEALAAAEEALARVGLENYADRITHKLSGGEKRLVSLASVLAMKPEALLLDEPTSGLDDDAEGRLIEVLQTLDAAMVLVCHDGRISEKIAARPMFLRDGKIES